MAIKNTKTQGEVFFGLHMVEGTAEYNEPNKQPDRIYIGQQTIRNMNPSFQGKPVYVDHVGEVDERDLESERELDGIVVRSFYNQADGRNWAEFIVFTQRAKQAIADGWTLSNAYVPQGYASGGENHGVAYSKEVTSGEFEHLAIVRNPRYEESVILTPEAFKAHNAKLEIELVRIANSKEPKKETSKMGLKLNIFKRTKVENSIDLDGLMVELPKSKKEVALTDVVAKYDAILNMNGYANGDHMVKLGDDEMSVNDLVKKHMEMCNAAKEKEAMENAGEGEPGMDIENGEDEDETVDESEKDVGDRGGDESLDNAEDDEDEPKEKKKNSADPKAAAKAKAKVLANAKEKAAKLKNARPGFEEEETAVVETTQTQVSRGQKRYGS